MKILHTSDWHIGRTFHGHSTLEALSSVLDVMVEEVRVREIDVVIVAGDVFDSATPSAACYPVLAGALSRLREAGAKVIVTSGNHDSAARLGFMAEFTAGAGIHIVTDPASVGQPIHIDDEHGPVLFYGIPYLEPTMVRTQWPGVALRTQEQTITHAMGLVRDDLAARRSADAAVRSVAISHCFAAGIEPSAGVERDIQSGGIDVVPLSAFDGPDYVALGHIHGRAELTPRVRYSGAPLFYSFSEQHKARGAWLVELDAAGLADVSWMPLPIPRALVTLTGTLDELLEREDFAQHRDDWVCAVLTDAAAPIDPMRKLQARFPWCATLMLRPAGGENADGLDYGQRVRAATSDTELVDAFLQHVRAGEGLSNDEGEILHEMLEQHVAAEALA